MKIKISLIFLLVLAIANIYASFYLTKIHYQQTIDPFFESSCNFSSKVSCDTVLATSYSKILSVPIAYEGLVYNLLIFVLILAAIIYKERTKTFGFLLFHMLGFSVLFSIYMAVVSFFILKTICPYCFSMYIFNLVSFILSFFMIKGSYGETLKLIINNLKNGLFKNTAFLTVCAAILFTLFFLVPKNFIFVNYDSELLYKLDFGTTKSFLNCTIAIRELLTKPEKVTNRIVECFDLKALDNKDRSDSAIYIGEKHEANQNSELECLANQQCTAIYTKNGNEDSLIFALKDLAIETEHRLYYQNHRLVRYQKCEKSLLKAGEEKIIKDQPINILDYFKESNIINSWF